MAGGNKKTSNKKRKREEVESEDEKRKMHELGKDDELEDNGALPDDQQEYSAKKQQSLILKSLFKYVTEYQDNEKLAKAVLLWGFMMEFLAAVYGSYFKWEDNQLSRNGIWESRSFLPILFEKVNLQVNGELASISLAGICFIWMILSFDHLFRAFSKLEQHQDDWSSFKLTIFDVLIPNLSMATSELSGVYAFAPTSGPDKGRPYIGMTFMTMTLRLEKHVRDIVNLKVRRARANLAFGLWLTGIVFSVEPGFAAAALFFLEFIINAATRATLDGLNVNLVDSARWYHVLDRESVKRLWNWFLHYFRLVGGRGITEKIGLRFIHNHLPEINAATFGEGSEADISTQAVHSVVNRHS